MSAAAPTGRPICAAAGSSAEVAAFDFDRTLTTRDVLRVFLVEAVGRRRFAVALLRTSPEIAALALGGNHRDRARGQAHPSPVDRHACRRRRSRRTCCRHRGRTSIPTERRDPPAPLAHRIRSSVIVVSASFTPYVEEALAGLGVEAVIATRWEVDDDGVLTGRLLDGNVRGPRKAELLAAYLGSDAVAYAYGDSAGDDEMLAMSSWPHRVTRSGVLRLSRAEPQQCGLQVC